MTTGSMLSCMYECCEQKTCAGGRLEADLKQLASRPNQNKSTDKTEAIFFLKSVAKKKGLNSPRDCLDTELNNNAQLL